jgi:hypothetical protein
LKKSLKRIRTVWAMEGKEKKLLRQAATLLFQVRLRMIFTSFPKVLVWAKTVSSVLAEEQQSTPERLAWMVDSTGIVFPHLFKCLPRALAGFILLRRCGWEVTLKIGARRRQPSMPLEAHAWLEREGTILVGELYGMDKYAVFETFEGKYL